MKLKFYIPSCILFVIIIAFFFTGSSLTDFPLDDAWIHAVYAESVAMGDGFCYNQNQPETGSTSPLWVLLTAPTHMLPALSRSTPALYTKALGLLLGLIIICNVQYGAQQITGSIKAGIIAGVLCSMDTMLLFSIGSGMENILLIALLLTAFNAWLKQRYSLSCLFISLAVVTRPEAIVFFATLIPAAIYIIQKKKGPTTAFLTGIASLIAPTIWVLFCLHTTGHPLPQTFYLKAHPISIHLSTFFIMFYQTFTMYGFSATPLFFLGLAFMIRTSIRLPRPQRFPVILFLIILPLIYLLSIFFSRSIDYSGYYWTRWLEPPLQLLTVASIIGTSACFVSASQSCRFKTSLVVILIAAVIFSIPILTSDFRARQKQFNDNCTNIRQLNVQSGIWLFSNTPPDAVIGLHDAGAIRYFSQRTCIDLAGLNYAPAAFGSVSFSKLMEKCDWLAIFPNVFSGAGRLQQIQQQFTPKAIITLQPDQYSIAKIHHPISQVMYEKQKE